MADEAQTTSAETTSTENTASTANTETTQTTTGLEPPKPIVGGDTTETTTEETKAEETKPDETVPEPKAPAEYADFTVPEGVTMAEQDATEFKGLAKELDLTQEQAQKVLDFGTAKLKAQMEAPYRLWAETQTKWQQEVKNDPDIGGTKFAESIAVAAKVFEPGESNPFVSNAEEAKSLREALNATGAGNNPAMVKLFVKMGRVLSEPGSLSGKPVRDTQEGLLDKLYPTMSNPKGA